MNLQKFFLCVLAAGALLVGCKEKEEPVPSSPLLSVTPTELRFAQAGEALVLSLNSNRPWSIETDADWLNFNPATGKAENSAINVTVTALSNAGNDRSATFKIKTEFDSRTVSVTQPGAKGEDTTDKPSGDGSKDKPYNPAGVVAYLSTLPADTESPNVVYITGKISEVSTTYEASGNYGNATFYISEDGSKNLTQFYVFQTYYLGNKKWKSGQKDVKVGDDVTVCGKVTNYKGNTPETVGKGGSYVCTLNGTTEYDAGGGQGDKPEAKGKGTLDDPYNPSAAADAVANLTWTSNTEYQTTDVVYVKGKISRIADNGTYTGGGTFGNASFFIVEDGTDYEFQVYRALYLGNEKYKSGQTDIKVGDTVIICGKLMNYHGNTPETDANNAYLYSLNGETGGGGGQGGEKPEAKGSGTLDDPYNPSAAADAVANLTWTSNTEYQTTDVVYVKGKISRIATKGTYTEGLQYGNASFFIVEDGTDYEFQVYRALYLGNEKYQSGQTDIKVDDEVIICGKLMNYRGNTPETDANNAYLYSLNGETGGGGQGGDSEVKTATIAEFIAAAKSTTQPYKLTGTVSNIKNETYGNFDLTDESGTVYIYGLVSKDLGGYTPNKANDKSFSSIGIKEGDKITIITYRDDFTKDGETTIQGAGSYYVSGASGGGQGGDSEVKTATVAEFIAAAKSTTQPYKLTGTVSNIKSDIYGNFDLTDDSGTVYIYGLVSKDLGGYAPNKANDKSFSSIGIKEGDKITIVTYRDEFTSDGQTTIEGAGGYYVSGASGGGGQGGEPGVPKGTGTLNDPYNPAAAADAVANLTWTSNTEYQTTDVVYVKGKISRIANNGTYTGGGTYGNASFWIVEEGSDLEFQVYRALYLGNKKFESGQTDIKVGDAVIICGKLMNYKGNTPETDANNAYLYSLNGKTEDDGQGGGEQGGETGGAYSSNVTWTLGESAYSDEATVNGTSGVACLKLGTSSKPGTATVVLPKGSSSITFYGVSWKDKKTTVTMKAGSKELFSQELATNAGASNKSPYTMTVSDSDCYTKTFEALTEDTTVTFTTTGANTRVILFGINVK